MDRVAGAVMVGVLVAKDDDESWSVSIGLVVVNVHFTGYQVLTRSEQRHRAEQLVIAEAERIAKEAAAP